MIGFPMGNFWWYLLFSLLGFGLGVGAVYTYFVIIMMRNQ